MCKDIVHFNQQIKSTNSVSSTNECHIHLFLNNISNFILNFDMKNYDNKL